LGGEERILEENLNLEIEYTDDEGATETEIFNNT